jgi:uncharacterized lipoprotein YmbA
MANRLVAYLSIALVATLAVACGASATSHFYTLSSTAASDGAPAASYAIAVGPVTIPGYADRPQFVVQAGPNRVELKEFERWATPLDEAVARVVAGDLATLLGATEVATVPLPTGFAPAYQVAIDVQRFESTPGQGVLLEAVWVARRAVGGEPRMGRTVANESTAGEGFETLAAAHSRALAKVSVDIAAAIRALAATKR